MMDHRVGSPLGGGHLHLWRPFLPDPLDDLVLELAVEANAECIVTHNRRDFAGAEQFGVRIVSPGTFLRQLGVES